MISDSVRLFSKVRMSKIIFLGYAKLARMAATISSVERFNRRKVAILEISCGIMILIVMDVFESSKWRRSIFS